MTSIVTFCTESSPIMEVIEVISGRKQGALLVTNEDHQPVGVISKSDLILAYFHDLQLEGPAGSIMRHPVLTCESKALLADTIQRMFVSDVKRIFVRDDKDGPISGVLSLSDATRFRSGTCRACGAGRILET